MNTEQNICNFCKQSKPVSRQYLHAANKTDTGDGFDYIYYCKECGLLEKVLDRDSDESIDVTPHPEAEGWV